MIKIHVGCGKRDFGPEWYQIDGEEYPHVQDHDIRLSKFRDESIEIIYASHFIEYFNKPAVTRLLGIWYRKLKIGGTIRLAVPDFSVMAKLHTENPEHYPLSIFLGPLYGEMEMQDETIYHKTCYTFQSISELLTEIGFKDVRRYDWRKTEHAHIDDHSRAHVLHDEDSIKTGHFTDKQFLISLNVEATK